MCESNIDSAIGYLHCRSDRYGGMLHEGIVHRELFDFFVDTFGPRARYEFPLSHGKHRSRIDLVVAAASNLVPSLSTVQMELAAEVKWLKDKPTANTSNELARILADMPYRLGSLQIDQFEDHGSWPNCWLICGGTTAAFESLYGLHKRRAPKNSEIVDYFLPLREATLVDLREPFDRTNWQDVFQRVRRRLRGRTLPRWARIEAHNSIINRDPDDACPLHFSAWTLAVERDETFDL